MVATRGKQAGTETVALPSSASTRSDIVPVVDSVTPTRRKRQRSPSLSNENAQGKAKRQNVHISTSKILQKPSGTSLGRQTRLRASSLVDSFQPTADGVKPAPNFGPSTTPDGLANYELAPGSVPEIPSDSDLAAIGITSQGYNPLAVNESGVTISAGPSLQVRLLTLPSLDNFATQILKLIGSSSNQEVISMFADQDSDQAKALLTLKELFSHTKKVYSTTSAFLDAHQLRLVDESHLRIIRKSNIATFAVGVFGSPNVTLFDLDQNFFGSIVAEGHQLLKSHAELLLELKTQAYIFSRSLGQQSRSDILEELFPSDMEYRLRRRRPDAKQLAPSERDFLQRAANRRKALLDEPDTADAIRALPRKYLWSDFTKDFTNFMSKNLNNVLTIDQVSRTNRDTPSSNLSVRFQKIQPRHSAPSMSPSFRAEAAATSEDIAGKAHRAAQFAISDLNPLKKGVASASHNTPQSRNAAGMPQEPKQPELHFHYENQLHPNVPGPQLSMFQNSPFNTDSLQSAWPTDGTSDADLVPYPTQSAPTQVLYERARQAASAKSSPPTRKTGSPGQRRPWTLEEENALMAGLDRVKGPHWSQILAMFGPGGTISEVLKDRNQVQLKDKARNLKLFFLKNNHEVPYYLQFVTGELKTRAPAQAAKNEAKGKRISEEDRAHVEGVMALASGPQQGGEPSNGAMPVERMSNQPNGTGPPNPFTDVANGSVDPTLEALGQAVGTARFGRSRGHVAPSADMLSGRQPRNVSHQQQQQHQNQFHYHIYADAALQSEEDGLAQLATASAPSVSRSSIDGTLPM